MMKTLNGKSVYLIKTTDLINSKLGQVINSLHLVAEAFTGWKQQFDAFADKQQCHFNLQQEFISIYAMEVNRAFISSLRLTWVDDLLRQLSHLARQGNIGFADVPQFLTKEITLKLSTVPAFAPAIDALCNGFAVMINPLMDFHQLVTSPCIFCLPCRSYHQLKLCVRNREDIGCLSLKCLMTSHLPMTTRHKLKALTNWMQSHLR